MNQISLRLKAYGEEAHSEYLIVEILIDGNPLIDFEVYATDFTELLNSSEQPGEYFIITCWCGLPECVGIRHGITVSHDHDTIVWRITKPVLAQRFVFSRAAYTQAIENCLKQGKRTIAYRQSLHNKTLVVVPKRNKEFFKV